jgi:hypothetical protein
MEKIMRKLVQVLAVIVCFSTGSVAFGQADETRIRSEAGGINQSPAYGRGSVTGLDGDVVIFKDPAGNVLEQRTVYDYAYPIVIGIFPVPPNPVVQVIENSGGMKTLRFDYLIQSKRFPALPGGTVEVVRNGFLIDRDRLYR